VHKKTIYFTIEALKLVIKSKEESQTVYFEVRYQNPLRSEDLISSGGLAQNFGFAGVLIK
jgi:hypothetical protein